MKAGRIRPAAIARTTLAAGRAANGMRSLPFGRGVFLQNAIRVFVIVVFFCIFVRLKKSFILFLWIINPNRSLWSRH